MQIPKEIALVTQLVLRVAAEEGVEPQAIMADAKIPSGGLENPFGHIPFHHHLGALRSFSKRSGGDPVSLRVGAGGRRGDYDLLSLYTFSTATIAGCFDAGTRFFEHFINYARIDRIEAGDISFFRLRRTTAGLEGWEEAAELTLSIFNKAVKFLSQGRLAPLEVRFQGTQRTEFSEYERVFRAPVRFQQPHDELVFHTGDLAMASPLSDPVAHKLMQREIFERIGQKNTGRRYSERVMTYARREISAGEVSLEHCAHWMNLAVRTLRHKRKEEGTSFHHLCDRVRLERAEELLLDPEMTIAEIAFAVGFEDPRSLNKAFRRWHDMTPLTYRRTRVPDQEPYSPAP